MRGWRWRSEIHCENEEAFRSSTRMARRLRRRRRRRRRREGGREGGRRGGGESLGGRNRSGVAVIVVWGRAKGAAKASCGETVLQKGVFGESVSTLPP